MLRTIAIVGATAAGIVGVGTAALAATGGSSSSTSGTSSTSAASTAALGKTHPRLAKALARRAVHGEFVTRNGSGGFTTHDGIRGTVTAVSPTSITVKAADDFSQTYAVTTTTKVRARSDGKGAASSISAVHVGDNVGVLGTGTSTVTATYVIDGLKG